MNHMAKISDTPEDVLDLIRDPISHVVVSDGGRDKGPAVRTGRKGHRLVHGDLESIEVQYEAEKSPKWVNRKADLLRVMFKKKEITDDLYSAGLRFQNDFDRGHWGSSSGMRFDNLPASGRVSTDGGRTDATVDARRSIMDAITILGGEYSLAATVAKQILGNRKSLTEMANDNGDHRSVYKGAFVAMLESLNAHYQRLDYERRKPTRR